MPCGPVGLGDIEDSAQASKKTEGTLSESLQGDFGRSRLLDSPLLWLSCSWGETRWLQINTAGSGTRGGHPSLEVEVFSCELKPELFCGMCSG